jgi:hypothetical protein
MLLGLKVLNDHDPLVFANQGCFFVSPIRFLVYHVLSPRGFLLVNILLVKIYYCGFLLDADDPKIYQLTKSAGGCVSLQMHAYWVQNLHFENYVYYY